MKNKLLLLMILMLSQISYGQSVEYHPKTNYDNDLLYYCVIKKDIDDLDPAKYELVNYLEHVVPFYCHIAHFLPTDPINILNYIDSTQTKKRLRISKKDLPNFSNQVSTISICELRKGASHLILTNCIDCQYNNDGILHSQKRIAAITRDGMTTSHQYRMQYKYDCELAELSQSLLQQKSNRDDINSPVTSTIRATIGALHKEEAQDLKVIISTLKTKKIDCLELVSITLIE